MALLLKDLASAPETLGFAPERLAFAPERRGIASERLGFAPERLGFAPERLGFAPEGLGFAPERLGFARIRKPATLIFGFWQGKSEYVHGKPVVLATHGACYSGLDIVGVCGAVYEHPRCWGLHI